MCRGRVALLVVPLCGLLLLPPKSGGDEKELDLAKERASKNPRTRARARPGARARRRGSIRLINGCTHCVTEPSFHAGVAIAVEMDSSSHGNAIYAQEGAPIRVDRSGAGSGTEVVRPFRPRSAYQDIAGYFRFGWSLCLE
jgi:hypothetical protein